jgi:hypothetical protein
MYDVKIAIFLVANIFKNKIELFKKNFNKTPFFVYE